VTTAKLPLLLMTLAVVFGCDQRDGEQYLLGHIAPLSGANREAGQQSQRGVQLAVEECNAESKNWIGGRKVAALHADSASEAKTAGGQSIRLVTVNHADALIGSMSAAEAVQINTTAREYSLVAINGAGVIDPAPNASFSIGRSDIDRARAVDRFLVEQLKPKNVAIVVDGKDSTWSSLVDELARLGRARNVFAEQFQVFKDDDVSKAAARFGNYAGTIIVAAPARQFLKLRELLIKDGQLPEMIFVGDDGERDQIVASADQAYLVGGCFVNRGETYDQFAGRFFKRFGVLPTAEAIAGYDSTRILLSAAREVGGFHPQKLRDKLASLGEFDAVIGKLTMGADHFAHGPTFIVQVDAGKQVIKQRYD